MKGRSSRRTGCTLALLVAAIAVLACVILIRPPSWWQTIPVDDAPALAMGENFENACITETHRVREPGLAWARQVYDDDVNAWLATRLPKWLDHAGMSKLSSAVVRFNEGAIEIASDVADLPTVAVIEIVPRMADGKLRVERTSVALGRLPLPFAQSLVIGPLLSALHDNDAPPEVKIAAALLNGEEISAQFKLADGRIVRLRDLEVHDGKLLLEFETLPRKP